MEEKREPLSEMAIERKIQILRNKHMDSEVIALVKSDYEYGLTDDEIGLYLNKSYDIEQMKVLSKCLHKGVSEELLTLLKDSRMAAPKMQTALDYYEKGVPIDAIREVVQKDDTAVIDFEGFVDGEPFQGGKGEDYSLVIGSHSFIDTFEDQLVGKKAGEEVDVNVTFPEEYHEASLKGKPALFKVTVKEIKKKELPKLDDEFASEVSEFETLKEYKASVKKNLTERRKEEAKREKENEVVEKVVENITVELPEPMVDEQTQQMIQEFAGRLSSQGLSFDQYMQMTGMTVDALMGQMKPEAEKRIRTRLALEAIVDAEKIKATAKDIDKEIENMANMYQMEVDKIKEMIGDAEKEQIGKDLAVQKAVDFVVKNAVEVEPAEEDKEEK